MTSDSWPYAMDGRGFPIVTCFLDASNGLAISSWRSYVVLPNGKHSILARLDEMLLQRILLRRDNR